jgi:hypothetical protein
MAQRTKVPGESDACEPTSLKILTNNHCHLDFYFDCIEKIRSITRRHILLRQIKILAWKVMHRFDIKSIKILLTVKTVVYKMRVALE